MKILHVIFWASFATAAIAQQSSELNRDPAARAILEALASSIASHSDITYHFTLRIEYPESDDQIIEGMYLQKGRKYRLETPTYYFISDALSKWVVDVNAKEIQIHDLIAASGTEISDPQSLLTIYQNPHFDYRLAFAGVAENREVQIIEFKPSETGSDMVKANLVLDKQSGQMSKMEVFNRDGSRLHLTIDHMETDIGLDDAKFTPQDAQFAGFHTEDLRIE